MAPPMWTRTLTFTLAAKKIVSPRDKNEVCSQDRSRYTPTHVRAKLITYVFSCAGEVALHETKMMRSLTTTPASSCLRTAVMTQGANPSSRMYVCIYVSDSFPTPALPLLCFVCVTIWYIVAAVAPASCKRTYVALLQPPLSGFCQPQSLAGCVLRGSEAILSGRASKEPELFTSNPPLLPT